MSDYFGALLRSAGALPTSGGVGPSTAVGAELVEQDVEVEAGAVQQLSAASRRAEPAPPSAAAAASEDAPVRRDVPHGHALPAPPSPPAPDAEVHPVVRAALQWVAADPVLVSRVPAPTTATESRAEMSPQPALRAGTTATRQAGEAVRPSPLRTPAAAASTGVAAAPQEHVEVSIGTIHVRVDAPPAPRAAVTPAPPPQQRPQAQRPAPRSGFDRSRLPRL